MNVSELDFNFIELFDMVFIEAGELFGDPVGADPAKKKKIRRWVKSIYLDDGDFPENVMRYVGDHVPDSEFMGFLAACSEYVSAHGTKKRQLLEAVTGDFPEDVGKAFFQLFQEIEYCDTVCVQADKVVFTIEDTTSYRRDLVLHTVPGTTINKYELYGFGDGQIMKEENNYKLICTGEDPERGVQNIVGIFFTTASLDTQIFRADRGEFYDDPWETLSITAGEILGKSCLGSQFLNEKEQALLPLLKELRALSRWTVDDDEPRRYEILKRYLSEYGLSYVIPFVDNAHAYPPGNFKGYMANTKLKGKLNESACEPLWREIWGLVTDSQDGYPDKIGTADQRKLQNIRAEIEKKLHSLGYAGDYPTFRKTGVMKGLRLERSYDQSYLVGAEKNVVYIIHCRENAVGKDAHVQFLCGTALLKKGETADDIYSCCFNKKGRRIFKKEYFAGDDIGEVEFAAEIAAKRAECLNLTKEEKAFAGTESVSPWSFAMVFLITGGLFSGLMTAIMFLICCVVTAVMTGPGSIHEMISEMPWLLIFLIGFIGFGGGMAVVETMAKRK